MKKTILIVVGQALWAVSQALLILVLSHHHMTSTIGVFTLGLSIFAPLSLLFGLNLRVVIPVEKADKGFLGDALILRVCGLTLAYSLSLSTILTLRDASSSEKLIAGVLMAGRIGDQLSDLIVGVYQRDDKQERIALSFMLRGCAGALPFLGLFAFDGLSILWASMLSSIGVLAAALIFDLGYVLGFRALVSFRRGATKRIIDIVKRNYWVTIFPTLDSIHVNCFRIGVFLLCSTSVVGFVGSAQALFSPFQLVATAIGFIYLPRSIKTFSEDHSAYRRHSFQGILIGASLGISFILGVLLIGDTAIKMIFGPIGGEMRPALLATGVAMVAIHSSAFVGLSVVASGRGREYALAPALGIVTFSAVLAACVVLQIGSGNRLLLVAIAFTVSVLCRMAYSMMYIYKRSAG